MERKLNFRKMLLSRLFLFEGVVGRGVAKGGGTPLIQLSVYCNVHIMKIYLTRVKSNILCWTLLWRGILSLSKGSNFSQRIKKG